MSSESRKDREPKFQLQRRAGEMCGGSWLTQQSVNPLLLLLSCRIQAHMLYFPGVGEGGVARSLPKWCRWKEGSTLERDLRWEQRHGGTTLNNSTAHRAFSWPTPSLWCQPLLASPTGPSLPHHLQPEWHFMSSIFPLKPTGIFVSVLYSKLGLFPQEKERIT